MNRPKKFALMVALWTLIVGFVALRAPYVRFQDTPHATQNSNVKRPGKLERTGKVLDEWLGTGVKKKN